MSVIIATVFVKALEDLQVTTLGLCTRTHRQLVFVYSATPLPSALDGPEQKYTFVQTQMGQFQCLEEGIVRELI